MTDSITHTVMWLYQRKLGLDLGLAVCKVHTQLCLSFLPPFLFYLAFFFFFFLIIPFSSFTTVFDLLCFNPTNSI